jgi:peptide/nickel transport system substrate-binding protein
MLPLPVGVRGMPPDILKTVVGYDPDVEKNRAEAREFMQKLVYGPEKWLNIQVSTRNIAAYRDPDYEIGLNLTGSGVDDPDQQFYENYGCSSERNYTGYCNPELQKLFDQQSAEADQQKRKALVWDIDKKLQEDVARPIIYHNRGGTCWQPQLKGLTLMVNSIFNGDRFEDIWLHK